MGVSCLLLSPTLRSIIEPVTSLYDRYLRIESRVGHAISLAELDTGINIEVHRMTFPVKGIIKCDTYLQSICSLSDITDRIPNTDSAKLFCIRSY